MDKDPHSSDNDNQNKQDSSKDKSPIEPLQPEGPYIPPRPNNTPYVIIAFIFGFILLMLYGSSASGPKIAQIPYGLFLEQLKNDNVENVTVEGTKITGEFKTQPDNPEYLEWVKKKKEEEKKAASGDGKSNSSGSSENNAEIKPAEAKSAEVKPTEAKPIPDNKTVDNKTAETVANVPVNNAAQKEEPSTAVPVKTADGSKTDSSKVDGSKTDGSKPEKDFLSPGKDSPFANFWKQKPEAKLPLKFFCFAPIISLQDESVNQLLVQKLKGNYSAVEPTDYSKYLVILYIVISLGIFIFLWNMMRRTRDQMGGGFMGGFSRSPAKRFEATPGRTTFNDVAGLEGVKKELEEIVEYLKNPTKFQRLGARIPKGVLLNGPPGTGKTLLARAVAGEADVPFFSINGSEFIQMFVGVGASRVRDLFGTAKEQAPAILFIDEIDAVGRLRGTGVGGGHDEREQTLNQILSEMDGFAPNESVIVMAATNRPDVLDPALLRPGRFDRHITVDKPTAKGRQEMFLVHTKKVPLASDVDLERLAAATIGLTGADIRNIVNEAALWATRQDKDAVTMSDFEYAKDKVLMGAKREEVLTEKERRMTAFHEAGHALLAWLTPGGERVNKVTIVPRGFALGVTQLLPNEDQLSISESQLLDRLSFIMGGRAAEKVVFGEVTAGAENDLKQSTSLARRMVTHWGMSKKIGPVAFRSSEEHPFLGKEISSGSREFSEHTAQIIDEEVMRILQDASDHAEEMLQIQRNKLDALAEALLVKEELSEQEIEKILGAPAYRSEDEEKKS